MPAAKKNSNLGMTVIKGTGTRKRPPRTLGIRMQRPVVPPKKSQ